MSLIRKKEKKKRKAPLKTGSTSKELTQVGIGFSSVLVVLVLAEGFLSLRLQILMNPKHIVGSLVVGVVGERWLVYRYL